MTTALAGLCSWATFHPSTGAPQLGHIRALLFALFGIGSFLLPITHGLFQHGPAGYTDRIGLRWIGLTALSNGIGVVMYAFKAQNPCVPPVATEAGGRLTGRPKIPEKWYPRVFDIFGASHQIMHVMVVVAAWAYSQAVSAAFDYRHGHIQQC